MGENNTYEQEIELKDLMIAVFRRWRLIIGIAIIFGAILGGAKIGKSMVQRNDPKAVERANQDFEDAKVVYENTKASYEREVANIMQNIETQTEYNEFSTLMKISPYDKYTATADIFIKTDYQIMPELTYQNVDFTDSIIRAYSSAICQGTLLENIAKEMNTEVRYIQELVTVEEDFNNKMLHLTVSSTDSQSAEKIMTTLLNNINSNVAKLKQTIGEHSLSIMNRSNGSVVDLALSDKQKANSDSIVSLQDVLIQRRKDLKNLKEPQMTALSLRATLMTGVKYAVLGGVLGAFMVIFFVCVGYIMSDKIFAAKDIRNHFGIKILGQFKYESSKKFFGFIDKWIDKIEGNCEGVSDDVIYRIAVVNIRNYMGVKNTLLVTGTVGEDILNQVCAELQDGLEGYKVIVSGNMNTNPSTLERLPACDGVILVEQRGVSNVSAIKEEVEAVRCLDKKVLGCILL